jgi:hypothetical protein
MLTLVSGKERKESTNLNGLLIGLGVAIIQLVFIRVCFTVVFRHVPVAIGLGVLG